MVSATSRPMLTVLVVKASRMTQDSPVSDSNTTLASTRSRSSCTAKSSVRGTVQLSSGAAVVSE
ncbi:hypothetical protein D3C78_1928110 [compost metagenome]